MANTQLPLLPTLPLTGRIINVASVPQRSPFRYPGGKTWLVPYLRQWLASLPARPTEFIEPFAGGAIVGLTVGFETLAHHVTLIELDEQVAAVWQVVLSSQGAELAHRIATFRMTPANVDAVLSQPARNLGERAFQTILRNRINRGGILAPGAGKVKNGEAGKGLLSRWYPHTLQQRILGIAAIQDRFTFIHGDGLLALGQYAATAKTTSVFFIDPPYTAGGKRAGSRLYRHSEIDHAALFQIASTLRGDFLMTYDDAPEVRALAQAHGFETQTVPMKNTHHTPMLELLIGRNLNWARNFG